MSDSGIFKAAVKLPPEHRAAYLDRACGTNHELRREVESLLRAHDDAGSFLHSQGDRPTATVDEEPLAEQPGTVIGPYKLLQQIGEGGMGVVYLAEQQQPVRRKVALKIIKPGMDSGQIIARFEAERQALALMDHLNIARVLDAGTSDAGRPYFVMELVHGVPITRYCDDNRLTPRQRLELFVPVCQAIQHAHQKGIIHRDIKPSNVLVCLYDGKPVPKVIDFGVAKAIDQRLTERTLFTQFGTVVGTFEYMSPEQAEMSQLGVDTRSDIYSLGVLLYELLTGTTPLEQRRLREAAYGEILRLIREEEAVRPSQRLSTSGTALASISQQRSTNPAQLPRLVRGELDWLVMKCLEKDRTRRYDSASALSRDVERHLLDQPVEACPPTLGYRLRKAFRKNRAALLGAGAFAAVLLAATGESTWFAVQAERSRHSAVEAQDEAIDQRNVAVASERAARDSERRMRAAQWELRRRNYASSLNLAHMAWDDADVHRLLGLLNSQRPERAGTADDLRGFEWSYWWRLCHSDLLTLGGNKGKVNSVVFSPDGKRLAAGSGHWMDSRDWPGSLKVWDAATGQEVLTRRGYTGAVTSVAFSPDGKWLACGIGEYGKSGEVRVWDAALDKEVSTLRGHTGPVLSVAFSPDGKRLASGGCGGPKGDGPGELRVWDAATGQEVLGFRRHTGPVLSVAFSPDGQQLAGGIRGGPSAEKPGEVTVWDTTTGKEVFTLQEHAGDVPSVAFSPDGKQLAWGSGGPHFQAGEVTVVNAATGRVMRTLTNHKGAVHAVAFSPDGKRLASGSFDQTVRVWDLSTGQETLTLRGHADFINSVVFSPDGNRLASGSLDGTTKVWDAATGQGPRSLRAGPGPTANVDSVAFSPDSKRLASGSGGRDVKVWDVPTGREIFALQGHRDLVTSVAFSPDGKRLASGSWDGTIRVWDAAKGVEVLTLRTFQGEVWSLAFSPDSKRLASGGKRGTIKAWDVATGREVFALQGHREWVMSVAFSPDGKRLASAGWDRTVKVWDAGKGVETLTLQGAHASVAFSLDSTRLASCGAGTLKVWDCDTGQETLSLKGQYGAVAFSPDGKRLASGTADAAVKLWDLSTGQETLTLRRLARVVQSMAFSPDGQWLACCSGDQTVQVWHAPLESELKLP